MMMKGPKSSKPIKKQPHKRATMLLKRIVIAYPYRQPSKKDTLNYSL